jgi:hypothetical protein
MNLELMPVYCIDPIQDPRWEEFVQRHPDSSLFHSRAWLQSLNRTYGYKPVAYTTARPGVPLTAGIVCCRVRSIFTGSWLVSVPFADHCQPLQSTTGELLSILSEIKEHVCAESFRYFELRCWNAQGLNLAGSQDLSSSSCFAHHMLDLSPELSLLFRSLHPSCVQRKIRRAERERVLHEEGASDELIRQFYSLLIKTRRRHGLPPQPLSWFFNLRDAWGEALKVRVAIQSGRPIASIITILHKQCLTYKYGCSDARFHKLGGMPFLFWHSIRDAKQQGATKLDLGRSDLENQGLTAFKEHLGAERSTLTYYRYPARAASERALAGTEFVSSFCSYLPGSLLRLTGKLLYRHIG